VNHAQLLKLEDLPKWVQERIDSQSTPYHAYFDFKWNEIPGDPILFDIPLDEKKDLPKAVAEMLDVLDVGIYTKLRLPDGSRVIGLSTPLGGIALYEFTAPTNVPIDEKGTMGRVVLKHLKLHAPEVFWQAKLLELDAKGNVNLVTFLYLFGIGDPKMPLEKRNEHNIAKRLQLVLDVAEQLKTKQQ
jgi:hypothetical protein